jgi:DnaJ-domain-containing protein 1
MSEAPTAGKFGYRHLANLARLEAEDRRRELPHDIASGWMTMADAEDAIEAMQEIADILDWLADREIELTEEDKFGGDG